MFGDNNTATATDNSAATAAGEDNNTATASTGSPADPSVAVASQGFNNTATATCGGIATATEPSGVNVTFNGGGGSC